MTLASEHDVHKCSRCSKKATQTCKACRAMPNATNSQLSSTWYCGSDCQKAHWTEHKAQCKAAQARQALTSKLISQLESTSINITSASEHNEQHCSNCPKRATLVCKACKAMPKAADGQLLSIWYCGAECQKAHWTEHKTQCKAAQARQALYRAGATAQQIFYLFRKTIYMWNPHRIEKNGKTWYINANLYGGKSQVIPFPYELVPNVHDQTTLLTFQSCSDAVSEMHNVVKALFRGLCKEIDEVSHYVKGTKYDLKRVYTGEGLPKTDNTDWAHTVIRITTKSEETYAVDMTGAQYGWRESVIPWQQYNNSRMRMIKEVGAFGNTRIYCKTRAKKMGERHEWIHSIRERFAQLVDGAIAGWQKNNISLSDLLRLPEHEFQERQASLLSFIDECLQQYKALQESIGGFTSGIEWKYGDFRDSIPPDCGLMLGRRLPS